MRNRWTLPPNIPQAAKWPIRLTYAGLVGQALLRAFWPFATLLMLVIASGIVIGELDLALSPALLWTGYALAGLALLGMLLFGLWHIEWPGVAHAIDRVDKSLTGRPLSALRDEPASGISDDVSTSAIWEVHLAQMAQRAEQAQTQGPDLLLSSRDPFALRLIALLVFVVALVFGTFQTGGQLSQLAGSPGRAQASGPSWEGWIEPPAYTGRASIYLPDIGDDVLPAPQGSRVTIRVYGDASAYSLSESVSGRSGENSTISTDESFAIDQSGEIFVKGPDGTRIRVEMEEDRHPLVEAGVVTRGQNGRFQQVFEARDDYGIIKGWAIIDLNLEAVTRRHGLLAAPDQREAIEVDLPLPLSNTRTDFKETLIEEFSHHPWANLPVTITYEVQDAAQQSARSDVIETNLAGLRFFQPTAKAVIEQRRDLLWSRANARRVAQMLRAVSWQPQDLFPSETLYLRLRLAIRQLEAGLSVPELPVTVQEKVAQALWDIGNQLEFGSLASALERLQRAQERLSEAIENGAAESEIAELTQELREAMQDYIQQRAQQQSGADPQSPQDGEGQEITGDQLEQMLQQLQELMEQGRMAEAQRLLDQLQKMMENMRVTQGEGQGKPSPGQQALEDLGDTLRDQQGLSDETFEDLQNRFDPTAPQSNGDTDQGLAEQQQALRDRLGQQRDTLPGVETQQGREGREALDRAGRAMDQAQEALENGDLAGALDRQADAIDALRDGMRDLDAAINQQRAQENGQALNNAPGGRAQAQRDPLGRDRTGPLGSDDRFLQNDNGQRRAQELLEELRRRSGDRNRPPVERDYLDRLLERF